MPEPRIAVLIPYHGERELLVECLRSLDGSGAIPDEVCVFDDASETPPSDDDRYRFPVHIVRSERNVGPAFARNRLAALTTCEYVHFHDADDLFARRWAERMREVLNLERLSDAIFCEVGMLDHDGTTTRVERVQGLSRLVARGDLLEFAISGTILVPAGVYRREAFLACGGYNPQVRLGEDFEFHVRFALTRPRFVVVDESLVVYRRRPGSRSWDMGPVLQSFLESIEALASRVPEDRYRSLMADRAAMIGASLFRMGDSDAAIRAFRLAKTLGPADFAWEILPYRILARGLGPIAAERASAAYRRLLPGWFRRGVRRAARG